MLGLVLSIAAITALVFTIIEAPEWGWASAQTFAGFAVALLLLGAFVRWELGREHPMLPVTIFTNLRFSAASVAITAAFFALFGFIFLITQYFQLIRGYGPLEAGVRTLPVAFSIAGASIVAPRLVHRFGTTQVVRAGLALLAIAFVWIGLRAEVDTSYLEIVGQMVLIGVGLGSTTAPATESIMGSLNADKAGVGSAVNDTTRELGGTLGVAIIGSVFSSVYIAELDGSGGVFAQLPPDAQHATKDSVGAARVVAEQLGVNAGPYLDASERRLPQRPERRLFRRRRRCSRGSRVRQPIPASSGRLSPRRDVLVTAAAPSRSTATLMARTRRKREPSWSMLPPDGKRRWWRTTMPEHPPPERTPALRW